MAKDTAITTRATSVDFGTGGVGSSSNSSSPTHAFDHAPAEVVDAHDRPASDRRANKKLTWGEKFTYFKTKEFWSILALGQILAIAVTGTNTLSTFLVIEGTSIPAFQSLFNYVLLSAIYGSYTVYKYGFKGYGKLLLKDGWKYLILSFFDVEGNYFTVLAYRYTTILSAQLINFWAIVIVVTISYFFLKVRYHWAQILGIFICIGGMGILLASDHIQGVNGGDIPRSSQLKGDLFALVGATCYGLSNVYEEWFVSGRPLYEVIGQLGFWGIIINGVQAAIFDRSSFRTATWNSKVGGYLTGYTLILSLFYTLVPILYRLASAAFFNISLLTGNFWGVIIGTAVFGYTVHWMYPIAFALIMVGHFVYFLGKGVLGEAKKAWLGEQQERGHSGLFTARRKIEKGQVSIEAPAAGTGRGEGHEGAGIV
ncbi:hypothetical protein LTR05_003017 [Lithohypha guttulata]|uniref:DUF914-domain-containing protein n=1 Tax=Lithohypha guttulata TaxID=1690604 RepID=A0AAN7Y8L5_9EURO|nr:hypothetical protein LTR05_003017 [Lithohypha guttulata]